MGADGIGICCHWAIDDGPTVEEKISLSVDEARQAGSNNLYFSLALFISSKAKFST